MSYIGTHIFLCGANYLFIGILSKLVQKYHQMVSGPGPSNRLEILENVDRFLFMETWSPSNYLETSPHYVSPLPCTH